MKILTLGKINTKSLIITVVFLFLLAFNASKAQAADTFLIDSSYDSAGRTEIPATNRVNGSRAYFYFEDAYWAKLSPADQNTLFADTVTLSNEFDNAIYPKMREIYNTEWSPGVDNDPKIYILLTDIVKDAGGYFNPYDEYPKSQTEAYKAQMLFDLEKEKEADKDAEKNIGKYVNREKEIKSIFSNEREIIYLNIDFIGRPNVKSYLAHEFQHMINWYQKKKLLGADEEVWLNEGLSEYAATALGYDDTYAGSNLEFRAKNFLANPTDSLTEWQNLNQDYSTINLFMQFMVEHYGKNIIKTIINTPKTGTEAIDEALQKVDPKANFMSVFNDWVIANYLNDQKVSKGKYAYSNPNLSYENFHVNLTSSYLIYSNIKAQEDESIKDWSGRWYEFDSSQTLSSPNQTLKIDFSADDPGSKFTVPYVVKNRDGSVDSGFLSLDLHQKGAALISNFGTTVSSVAIMPFSGKKLSSFANPEPETKFFFTATLAESTAPVINDVTPHTAAMSGGEIITITGENFDSNSIVKIGGIVAPLVSISSSKTIIAKVPPALNSGEVKLEVINANSISATSPQSFVYLPGLKEGSLIRAIGDYKVYVINDKYKRWIQSAQIFKFYPHFGWNAVITVTPAVRDSYLTSTLVKAARDYKVYEVQSNNTKQHLDMSAEKFTASGRFWNMIFTINNAERNFYKTGIPLTE